MKRVFTLLAMAMAVAAKGPSASSSANTNSGSSSGDLELVSLAGVDALVLAHPYVQGIHTHRLWKTQCVIDATGRDACMRAPLLRATAPHARNKD